jgi:hypothetical protein
MKKMFNIVLGLVLLIMLAILLVSFTVTIFNAFTRLNLAIQASIATGLSLIVVAVVGYFANKSIEMRKSVEQAIRPRKLELYQEFVSFFLRALSKEGVAVKPTEQEMKDFYNKSTPLIATFASNAVIAKWGKLRITMGNIDPADPHRNLFQFEELLKEIRRDLGHSSRGSKKGDILRLLVNDIDEHLDSVAK